MPAALQNASILHLAVGIISGPLLVSLMLFVVLKYVTQSVFKFDVGFFSAFKAMFAAFLPLTMIIVLLVSTKTIQLEENGGSIALQIIGLVVGVVILAFTVAVFIRDAQGRRPDFAKAGVVAAIMQVICLVVALVISLVIKVLGLPMTGVS